MEEESKDLEVADSVSASTAEFTGECCNQEGRLEQLKERILNNWGQCETLYLAIGGDLVEAKELFGRRGDWQGWLRANVPFSVRQAERLVRVAEWFGETTPGSRLDFSKAYLLTRLSKSKVPDFLKRYGTADADVEPLSVIQNMPKRKLEKAIREYLSSQAIVPNTCKDEKLEVSSPAPAPADSALTILYHLEDTMSELVKKVLNGQIDDEVHDTLIPEIRRICEGTLEQLSSEEIEFE